MVKRVPVKPSDVDSRVNVSTDKSTNVASIEIVEGKGNYTELRLLAKMVYVASPTGLSVEKLSQREPFAGNVTVQTLTRWSVKDRWVDEREKHRQNLEQAILKRLGNEQIKAISEQIERIQEVRTVMYDTILSEYRPGAKSLEGAVTALIRLEQFMLDSRSTAANIFAGSLDDKAGDETKAPSVSYPVDSLREAAIALIKVDQKRRKNDKEENK